MESLPSAIGQGDDVWRLVLAPPAQRLGDTGCMAVVPGRLHQQPADMLVAGLGDRAAILALAAGALAGDQPEIGHQGARRGEAAEVVQLGHDAVRRQRVDAAEAPESGHRLAVGIRGGDLSQAQIRLGATSRSL